MKRWMALWLSLGVCVSACEQSKAAKAPAGPRIPQAPTPERRADADVAPKPRMAPRVAKAPAPRAAKAPAIQRPKSPKPPKQRYLRKPPKGFVDLQVHIPGIKLQIGYHTKDNFTGAPLPGYGAPGAWMLRKAADALAKVQRELATTGMGLLVYDAYRPKRGTLGMAAWARREGKLSLFRTGYIAYRSGHNHGHTVDLTIVDSKSGKPLDMGTPWDTLDTRSNTRNAKGKALQNRLLLRRVMRKYGFRPYSKEWWHFGFRMKGTRPRDVPYGCFEAPEGKWKPTRGWDRPGYKMPLTWTPTPCL